MRRWDPERWQRNEDGSYSRRLPLPVELEPLEEPEPEPEAESEIDATEGAIERAAELGLDLADVKGSGKDGRITKADVEAAYWA